MHENIACTNNALKFSEVDVMNQMILFFKLLNDFFKCGVEEQRGFSPQYLKNPLSNPELKSEIRYRCIVHHASCIIMTVMVHNIATT
jgi:hypothetical protein